VGSSLGNKQRSLLIGSLLGDGTLNFSGNFPNLKIEHCLKQRFYVFYKYRLLKQFVSTSPNLSYRYDNNREPYPKSWWFRTIGLETLKFYYGLFYINKIKVIPNNIEKLLDPLVLAIWAMDDGSSNNNRTAFYFNSQSFSLFDQLRLCKILKNKFYLNARTHKDKDKYRIYIPVADTNQLHRMIYPYLLPQFVYKFPNCNPVTTEARLKRRE
jgi:hypothetical protein